jgi:diaminopimelate epimerase
VIFSRMSGAGNSFYLCEDRHLGKEIEKSVRPLFVKTTCQLFPNAPTDGFIFLEKHSKYDFEWDFYNADGSHAEMCGNAARCVSRYFYERISAKKNVCFLTGAGLVSTELLLGDRVRVLMPKITRTEAGAGEQFFVNTGVPHFVVEREPDLEMAKNLRPQPGPSGSNVTFVSEVLVESNVAKCKAVTYERGVEGWTSACGTGAVAAAVYLSETRGASHSLVQMPGGVLEVTYHGLSSAPELVGSAQFDYELEIDWNASRFMGLEYK